MVGESQKSNLIMFFISKCKSEKYLSASDFLYKIGCKFAYSLVVLDFKIEFKIIIYEKIYFYPPGYTGLFCIIRGQWRRCLRRNTNHNTGRGRIRKLPYQD